MTTSPAFTSRSFNTCAEAILVRAHHAAPLPPGARLWLNRQGGFQGAISMGCVDQDVVERLRGLAEGPVSAQLVTYAEGNELTGEVGLTCGGRIDILLRRQSADDPVAEALGMMSGDEGWTLVTALAGEFMGRQRLYRSELPPLGSLGAVELDEAVDRIVPTATDEARVHELGGTSVLVECHEVPPCLLVVGASAIAEHLCALATRAGFRVFLADPRRDLARSDRFMDAVAIEHVWPEEAFARLGVDASWYIAVLAHDLKLDTPALAGALRCGCVYVGLLGSERTQKKHQDRLRELGFDEQAIAKVRGPIGLEIEAITPAEIAVSILAEMIQVRRCARVFHTSQGD